MKKSKQLVDAISTELRIATTSERSAAQVVKDRKEELRRAQIAVEQYQAVVAEGKEVVKTLEGFDAAAWADRDLNAELEAAADKLTTIEEERHQVTQRLAAIDAQLAAAQKNAELAAELERQLGAVGRELRVARHTLRAFGPSGVPADVAKSHVNTLRDSANALLEGVGVSIDFSWERETDTKAMSCEACGFQYESKRGNECPGCHAPRGFKRSDELEILLEDGSGGVEDVRYSSGGTRTLVGTAIRLAASAMLRNVRHSPVAFAIVDEPFGALDTENREQLARTFAGLLGSVGFEQALVVSHDPVLLGALPHRIVVDRADGASRLRLE